MHSFNDVVFTQLDFQNTEYKRLDSSPLIVRVSR